MSSNLTPVSEFTEPVVVPSDGDALTAASVIAPLQAVTNRGEFVRDRAPFAQSQTDFAIPLSGFVQASTASDGDLPYIYRFTTSQAGWVLRLGDEIGPSFLVCDVPLIPGLQVTGAKFHIMGRSTLIGNSPHSDLPAGMPECLAIAYDADGLDAYIADTVTDTSASVGAYDALHTLTLPISYTAVAGHRLSLILASQYSTNGQDNAFTLCAASVSWTPPA